MRIRNTINFKSMTKEQQLEYARTQTIKRRKAFPIKTKVMRRLSHRLVGSLNNYGLKPLDKSTKLLGCTIDQYVAYLTAQFVARYGVENVADMFDPKKYQLHHIIAISCFQLSTLKGQQAAFNYKNTTILSINDHYDVHYNKNSTIIL